MEIISPLRAGSSGGDSSSGVALESPPPTLMEPQSGSLTLFLPFPPRLENSPVPEWAWKFVHEQMNMLRLQMGAKWVEKPFEVWRQKCLNQDMEVMFAAYVRHPSRRSKATSLSVVIDSSSEVSDQIRMGLIF